MQESSKMACLALAVVLAAHGHTLTSVQENRRSSPAKRPHADNSRCFVCHVNYEDEPLARSHAKANIGCVKCHGVSTAHASSEDNTTAPDIMYSRVDINRACLKCHESGEFRKAHKATPTSRAAESKVCTDCHGKHRLNFRERHWDKGSGKLLSKGPGRART